MLLFYLFTDIHLVNALNYVIYVMHEVRAYLKVALTKNDSDRLRVSSNMGSATPSAARHQPASPKSASTVGKKHRRSSSDATTILEFAQPRVQSPTASPPPPTVEIGLAAAKRRSSTTFAAHQAVLKGEAAAAEANKKARKEKLAAVNTEALDARSRAVAAAQTKKQRRESRVAVRAAAKEALEAARVAAAAEKEAELLSKRAKVARRASQAFGTMHASKVAAAAAEEAAAQLNRNRKNAVIQEQEEARKRV